MYKLFTAGKHTERNRYRKSIFNDFSISSVILLNNLEINTIGKRDYPITILKTLAVSKNAAKHATQLNHQILKFLRGYVHCLNCKDGDFDILKLDAGNISERYRQH